MISILSGAIAVVLNQDYGSSTTEYVSGGSIDEVREVDLKQEPNDVCCIFVFISTERLFRSLVTGHVFRSTRDSGWHTYNVGNLSIQENFNMFSIIKMQEVNVFSFKVNHVLSVTAS